MLSKSATDEIQGSVSKPSFWKFPSHGEDWKSDSMRIISEEFVRSTEIEHRVVCSVRWGNSWQFWIERGKSGMVIWKQDWDGFVDTNLLGPNDVLFFEHQDTMFLQLRIFKKDGEEIIHAPEPETEPVHPKPQNSYRETTPAFASARGRTNGPERDGCADVKNLVRYNPKNNPERYLLNPNNPYFVKTLTKKNDVLYVPKVTIDEYGLKFGPVNSAMRYILPKGKRGGLNKLYTRGPCFNGWTKLCRKHKLNTGDSVVCELELSGGIVAAVRVHFIR